MKLIDYLVSKIQMKFYSSGITKIYCPKYKERRKLQLCYSCSSYKGTNKEYTSVLCDFIEKKKEKMQIERTQKKEKLEEINKLKLLYYFGKKSELTTTDIQCEHNLAIDTTKIIGELMRKMAKDNLVLSYTTRNENDGFTKIFRLTNKGKNMLKTLKVIE